MSKKSKESTSIRWGMIGCGAVTELKSGPAYQNTDGFELVGVTRRNLALAEDYARRHKIKFVFSSAEELINSEWIDAVYIATPPDSHKFYALQVAQAGKICCVEKPLSSKYSDSLAIAQAFTQRNIPLFVAYYRRCLPRFNKVKSLIDNQVIGKIRHLSWTYNRPASQLDLSRKNNWRTDRTIARGGYFDDLASHGLDLFGYIFGEYEQVKGLATNQQNLYSAFDSVVASWKHKNNITGSGSWNFAAGVRTDEVKLYGEKGEIAFSVFAEQPILVSNHDGDICYSIENPTHIQQHHVAAIRNALQTGVGHPSTGESALHTCWVMEQILD